ncbi:MAG: hypothetical protein FJY75_03475 [Candidatus Eisenbacteria bacterium]|uniref:Uncharacterized protein n=1 Tax=Eiseniibacteriota bacterium TaxID=2212470 RepID=A0A938BQ87_UNCEI|nr:hypothetical protein [Candidatus Eisenbacteria bacterium]
MAVRTGSSACSLLIYQHFPREPRAAFARRMVYALRVHTEARRIAALRTAHVLFLLAAQGRHQDWIGETLAALQRRRGDEMGIS